MGINIFNQTYHAPAICQDSDDAATVAAAAAAAAALPLKFQPFRLLPQNNYKNF